MSLNSLTQQRLKELLRYDPDTGAFTWATNAYKNNTSGATGVGWHKRRKKWQVFIRVNDRQVYGGIFTCKQEAIAKREALEKKHHFI